MKLSISNEAYSALDRSKYRTPGADLEGTQLPGGRWEIDLDPDTLKRLVARQFPGESLSDTLIRLLEERPQ